MSAPSASIRAGTIESVLRDLREPDLLPVLHNGWDASMREFPACGMPDFLTPEGVARNRATCGLAEAAEAPLRAAAARIVARPALCRLAWHYAWRIFDSPKLPVERWPRLENESGVDGAAFALLIALSMAPRVRRFHRMMGIPESVTRETCLQPRCMADLYQRAHPGQTGMFHSQTAWLRHYAQDLYVRIGRFEYWAKPFKGSIAAFRHRITRKVTVLAENGALFNAEGFMDPPDKIPPGTPGWTATFRLDEHGALGHPVSPLGKACSRAVRLPFSEWECVLTRDDPVLEIHIPAGGGMAPEACIDSLRRARDFFRRFFPARSPRAFTSTSWIFSPLLEHLLPGKSNLVRCLSETHLFPIPVTGPDPLWFVFFQKPFNPATAPRDTSVQRALLGYLDSGHVWRNGGMVLMTDDLDQWGTQFYRRAWRDSSGNGQPSASRIRSE